MHSAPKEDGCLVFSWHKRFTGTYEIALIAELFEKMTVTYVYMPIPLPSFRKGTVPNLLQKDDRINWGNNSSF